MLLQYRLGATSFEALRTIEGKLCPTFRDAAYELGFITSPKHIQDMLDECCSTMMSKPLRSFFAYLILTCDNIDVMGLWTKFKDSLCDKCTEHEALMEIESLLSSEDKS